MEKCKQNESEARGMATTGKEIADAYSYPAYIGLNVVKCHLKLTPYCH